VAGLAGDDPKSFGDYGLNPRNGPLIRRWNHAAGSPKKEGMDGAIRHRRHSPKTLHDKHFLI
jgi:hypothetical protein